jgi:hypothetical protein
MRISIHRVTTFTEIIHLRVTWSLHNHPAFPFRIVRIREQSTLCIFALHHPSSPHGIRHIRRYWYLSRLRHRWSLSLLFSLILSVSPVLHRLNLPPQALHDPRSHDEQYEDSTDQPEKHKSFRIFYVSSSLCERVSPTPSGT